MTLFDFIYHDVMRHTTNASDTNSTSAGSPLRMNDDSNEANPNDLTDEEMLRCNNWDESSVAEGDTGLDTQQRSRDCPSPDYSAETP